LGRVVPEPLPPGKRRFFLWFGLCSIANRWLLHLAIPGFVGWFLIERFGGAGFGLGILALCLWFWDVLRGWLLGHRLVRWVLGVPVRS